MVKIYIDTNIFLDFYQSGKDRLGVFREIHEQYKHIVLAEQTIDEFLRNRISRLKILKKAIQDTSSGYKIYETALIRELPNFDEWRSARDNVGSIAKELVQALEKWIDHTEDDPVLIEFNQLRKSCEVLNTTSSCYERAMRRKALGQPPTSHKKDTIGDQLIWETLLDGVHEDLIIVTRDHTFSEHQPILKKEFAKIQSILNKRELLLVTGSLNQAFESIGEHVPNIEASEKFAEEAKEIFVSYNRNEDFDKIMKMLWKKMSQNDGGICPKCHVGELLPTGFEGSDGDEAGWLYCGNCGYENLD
ncbi:MAG: PIN domain-containing protein [Pseudomonadota bacterium]